MANEVLIAIGEALIDFMPDKKNCEFYEVGAFSPAVGGAPANVCGAFTKLEGKARMLTQLGDDPFGHKILRELSEAGIDTSCIQLTKKANTALAFVSLGEQGHRTFSFYRKPSADMLLEAKEVKDAWFEDVYCLHFCSVSLGEFPMKEAHKKAIALTKAHHGMVSFDPNLRFQLWENREKLRETVNEFIPMADILKVSDEELEFITGEHDTKSALEKLFTGNVKLVIYTCGESGAYAITNSYQVFSPSRKVEAKDTTGAGDGFIGAFLWKFKELGLSVNDLSKAQEALKRCLQFANVFCGESVKEKGAIASYPNAEKMKKLL